MPDPQTPDGSAGAFARLANQPYLLLTLTALFWAGNIVIGRAIADQLPPVLLSFVRWSGAFLLMLPFAWPHIKHDAPAIRAGWKSLLALSLTGITIYHVLSYYALGKTQAINALLIQSAGPLFIALWAAILYRTRLSWAQALGIALSLCGVLTIVLRGDPATLASVDLNIGDLAFLLGDPDLRSLFGAETPADPSTVTAHGDCGRCGAVAVAAAGGGTRHGSTHHCHRGRTRESRLYRDAAVGGGLSVLQPRRRIDRAKSGCAVLPSAAGIRLGSAPSGSSARVSAPIMRWAMRWCWPACLSRPGNKPSTCKNSPVLPGAMHTGPCLSVDSSRYKNAIIRRTPRPMSNVASGAIRALYARPYLLLVLCMLCWAGNIVIMRASAGHIPPMQLSFVRWTLSCLLVPADHVALPQEGLAAAARDRAVHDRAVACGHGHSEPAYAVVAQPNHGAQRLAAAIDHAAA